MRDKRVLQAMVAKMREHDEQVQERNDVIALLVKACAQSDISPPPHAVKLASEGVAPAQDAVVITTNDPGAEGGSLIMGGVNGGGGGGGAPRALPMRRDRDRVGGRQNNSNNNSGIFNASNNNNKHGAAVPLSPIAANVVAGVATGAAAGAPAAAGDGPRQTGARGSGIHRPQFANMGNSMLSLRHTNSGDLDHTNNASMTDAGVSANDIELTRFN